MKNQKTEEFNFIKRIRKLGVIIEGDTPAVIGVDLVIYEFKEFIRRLKEELLDRFNIDEGDLSFLKELAGEDLK